MRWDPSSLPCNNMVVLSKETMQCLVCSCSDISCTIIIQCFIGHSICILNNWLHTASRTLSIHVFLSAHLHSSQSLGSAYTCTSIISHFHSFLIQYFSITAIFISFYCTALECSNRLKSLGDTMSEINFYDELKSEPSGGTIATIFHALDSR